MRTYKNTTLNGCEFDKTYNFAWLWLSFRVRSGTIIIKNVRPVRTNVLESGDF